jgi:hypothetical protein
MNYTHRITYFKYIPHLQHAVTCDFRTTEDAVELHVRNLSRSKFVSNITVELL